MIPNILITMTMIMMILISPVTTMDLHETCNDCHGDGDDDQDGDKDGSDVDPHDNDDNDSDDD